MKFVKHTYKGEDTKLAQFESVAEALEVLGDKQALELINKAYKNVTLNIMALRKLRSDTQERVERKLKALWESATCDMEREAIIAYLDVDRKLMEDLCQSGQKTS